MKKKYIKPILISEEMTVSPLMNASFGNGYAEQGGTVLSKKDYNTEFEDYIVFGDFFDE